MIFLFKIIEKASSACQISVILCNQLTLIINTMKQIEQISCLLSLAWPSGGAQALRVLNQCNQLNQLTIRKISETKKISERTIV